MMSINQNTQILQLKKLPFGRRVLIIKVMISKLLRVTTFLVSEPIPDCSATVISEDKIYDEENAVPPIILVVNLFFPPLFITKQIRQFIISTSDSIISV